MTGRAGATRRVARRPSSRVATPGEVAAGLGAAVLLAAAHRRGVLAALPVVGGAGALAAGAAAWRYRRGTGRPAVPEGFASRRELAPLLVRSPPGDRIVLGRFGGRLVAAEARQSVLVVGPSQSGKTRGIAIPALLEWAGPVLATSVKSDLVEATIEHRRRRGEVAVFDPVGCPGADRASWSPLAGATTWEGARRQAHLLCAAGRQEGGLEDARFWVQSAERLLAPLLLAASLGGSMAEVVAFLDDEGDPEPERRLEAAGEEVAARVLASVSGLDARQRGSVYATAQTVVAAYGDPAVAASERSGRPVGGNWLCGEGARTLYCSAPARDQRRLAPVFSCLVTEVIEAAFERAAGGAAPLDPPLLVLLDEAANVAPVAELDSVVATAAAHGVVVLSLWQDLAQVEAVYGRRAATVVNNHRAKVVLPGLADASSLELVSRLCGEGERAERSRTRTGDGSTSETDRSALAPLAPPGWIRRLGAGTSLLVYGGLAPALLVTSGRPGSGRDTARVAGATRAVRDYFSA